jgi:hypothetical protein
VKLGEWPGLPTIEGVGLMHAEVTAGRQMVDKYITEVLITDQQ